MANNNKDKKVVKKGISKGKVLAVGAGLAAAGAGAYYLLGPDGKKHQDKMKSMAVNAEKKVKSKIKKVQASAEKYGITEASVRNVASKIEKGYKDISKSAVKAKAKKRA